MSILKRKKKTKEKEEPPIEPTIPIVAVPPNHAPVTSVQAFPAISEEQLKQSMETFIDGPALVIVDQFLWAFEAQYAMNKADEEGRKITEEILTRARPIMRELLVVLDKHINNDDANALAFAILFAVGCAAVSYAGDPLFQALVEAGQEWKASQGERPNAPFGRKDLGYG
jgi:hypothetical protein